MKKGFLLFLRRSLSMRKGRIGIASASITLAVAVVTGMVALTTGIRENLGAEIRAYGANIVVFPDDGGFLNDSVIKKLSTVEYVEDAAGQLMGKALIGNLPVDVLGLDVERLKKRGWRLHGMWPVQQGDVIAGMNLKDALKLYEGGTIRLETGAGKSTSAVDSGAGGREYHITGFIERGGPEDNALIMSLPDAERLLSAEGRLSSVLLRGTPGELDRIAQAIRNAYPALGVKTLRNIAFAEESLLAKMQLLMLLVTIVVVFAGAVTVGATIGANVLERRREIGLMKALGGTKSEIGLFYTAEAAFIGMVGGICGLALGSVSAEAVSKGAFQSFISIPSYLAFVAPAVGIVLAVSAAHVPVRQALGSSPAMVLRGE